MNEEIGHKSHLNYNFFFLLLFIIINYSALAAIIFDYFACVDNVLCKNHIVNTRHDHHSNNKQRTTPLPNFDFLLASFVAGYTHCVIS